MSELGAMIQFRNRYVTIFSLFSLGVLTQPAFATDADQDGIPDGSDDCPAVLFAPGFDWSVCGVMDLNPDNDATPECKARERVAHRLVVDSAFITHIAFAVVKNGDVHFADAFTYTGGGQYEHDPNGIHRLYRIGSTSKSVTAVAAKIMEENGELTFADFVSDDDGSQVLVNGQVTLRQLLSHRGAFTTDDGAYLFCYPGDLAAFWQEPNDLVSPHYDSSPFGNLGGGYSYSAFNYALAGAYIANRAGEPYHVALQARVFDAAGMCTAMFDGARATASPIGAEPGISQSATMHVGPYINLISPTDEYCEDNFYSSEDVYGDSYSWQYYYLDEASNQPRDPAGGAIASVVDMAHFAKALLDSYHERGGLLSRAGVVDLWSATTDLGCGGGCPYERYYGIGFFTNTVSGPTVTQVGHGGSRAGFKSAFVLRPEADLAVSILANADVSTVTLSNLAKLILDDFESAAAVGDFDGDGDVDLSDFSQFSLCFGGANQPAAAGCPPGIDADFDNDGDVDLSDFAEFSLNFTGPQ